MSEQVCELSTLNVVSLTITSRSSLSFPAPSLSVKLTFQTYLFAFSRYKFCISVVDSVLFHIATSSIVPLKPLELINENPGPPIPNATALAGKEVKGAAGETHPPPFTSNPLTYITGPEVTGPEETSITKT